MSDISKWSGSLFFQCVSDDFAHHAWQRGLIKLTALNPLASLRISPECERRIRWYDGTQHHQLPSEMCEYVDNRALKRPPNGFHGRAACRFLDRDQVVLPVRGWHFQHAAEQPGFGSAAQQYVSVLAKNDERDTVSRWALALYRFDGQLLLNAERVGGAIGL